MSQKVSLIDFCRYVLDTQRRPVTDDPAYLAALFREYAGIQRTPTLNEVVDLVRSFGIDIQAVDYLSTGGINMTAGGVWHIHYSAKDKPATQKFDVLHELFEVIDKTFKTIDQSHCRLKEPKLSRYADQFAAAVLIPHDFFVSQMHANGCDVARLGEELELSHQCLLIAFAEHFADIPVVAVLYEYCPPRPLAGPVAETRDFAASVVVKSPPARWVRQLCPVQPVPARGSRPSPGTLVCAAINTGQALLWRQTDDEAYPVILVRPLLWGGLEPYRVILLAVPDEEYNMISPQVDRIQPVVIGAEDSCPFEGIYPECQQCSWKIGGGYHEY
jgi:hypothetical protein